MKINNKTILITGGTGSFGKKSIEVLLKNYSPKKIIVFSRDELKQSELSQQFYPNNEIIRYFIGDVRDLPRLKRAFDGVDIVIHAAAMKQVPACEYNPMEAIKTNIIGSNNVINAAIDMNVKLVMNISTDKAVNPINLYGATKLAAEKLFIQSNSYAASTTTRFSCVRYGNVVGSRGSVIPLFLSQKDSGSFTITDNRMTRFWITLDEGVKFVLNGIERMNGGEIFVPKIPSMRIIDLAKTINENARIRIVGIRPGEKIHEVLISEDEARSCLEYDDFYIIFPAGDFWFGKSIDVNGRKLPEGFSYRSELNDSWLNEADILRIVNGLQ